MVSKKELITEIMGLEEKYNKEIFYDYKLKEFVKSAVNMVFMEEYGFSLNDRQTIVNQNKTIAENVNLNIERINNKYGTIQEFILIKEYADLKEYITFHNAKIKDNSIINAKYWRMPSVAYNRLFNFYKLIIDGENLKDFSQVYEYRKSADIDQFLKFDSINGEIKSLDYTLKFFKNGRVDIIFKDNKTATDFLREIKRLSERHHILGVDL